MDEAFYSTKVRGAWVRLAEIEANRMLMVKRGNLQKELSKIGEEAVEGTEIQTVTKTRGYKPDEADDSIVYTFIYRSLPVIFPLQNFFQTA